MPRPFLRAELCSSKFVAGLDEAAVEALQKEVDLVARLKNDVMVSKRPNRNCLGHP